MANKKLLLYTDGASRGNVGPSAIGFTICDENGCVLKEYSEYIGDATNNEAEYKALIKGLECAMGLSRGKIECLSDSELMVRHLNRIYRVRSERLKPLIERVYNLEKFFEHVTYQHVRRISSMLARADELANKALDNSGF